MYAAGWLNDSELNRGYSGSDESLSAITMDNQIDGSIDTGVINHRVLVGVDYQRRSNDVTASYGSFPAIDAFNPVYGADPLSITVYSREKHKLEQTGDLRAGSNVAGQMAPDAGWSSRSGKDHQRQ